MKGAARGVCAFALADAAAEAKPLKPGAESTRDAEDALKEKSPAVQRFIEEPLAADASPEPP